jgi:DNA-binding NtrC family response regulator
MVEAEHLVAHALLRALVPFRDGHEVERCRSSCGALERFDDASFDLLASGRRLTGQNGPELIELAHHRDPGSRSVLFTSFGSPQTG